MLQSPPPTAEYLLDLFLSETDETRSDGYLSDLLVSHAMPVINGILEGKVSRYRFFPDTPFKHAETEEIAQSCLLKLTRVLDRKKRHPAAYRKIADLRNYAAVTAFNECDSLCRRQFPLRYSLSSRLRYLLENDPYFDCWKSEPAEFWGGLAGKSREPAHLELPHLLSIINEHQTTFARDRLPDLVESILRHADGALHFDDLVEIVAELQNIKDLPILSMDNRKNGAPPPAKQSLSEKRLDDRVTLAMLWQELRLMDSFQRRTLLYRLRDDNGCEAVTLFFDANLATLAEIAEAFEITVAETALLLPRLPLAVSEIGRILNLPLPRVYRLRQSAHEYLRRRLEGRRKAGKR